MEKLKKGDVLSIKDVINEDGYTQKSMRFVVLSATYNELYETFDMLLLPLSYFTNEVQKEKKLKIATNFYISTKDMIGFKKGKYESYIKAEQGYYFTSANISYINIGAITEYKFDELETKVAKVMKRMKFKAITTNITSIKENTRK